MRQLRDGAGLGPAELAARAHYPYDRIKAAEVGPTLPDLPVLSAYVRGCGGTTEEWEERWRSLTGAPTLPLDDARPADGSTAASAGARIGSISPAADTPDPSVILAALDRVAEQMAVGTPAPLPSRSGISTIDQRPGVFAASPAPAASPSPPAPAPAPISAKPTGGKAGTAKLVTAWETTTMRTAWSSAAGRLAWETGQPSDSGGPTAAAGSAPSTAAGARTPTAPTAPTAPTGDATTALGRAASDGFARAGASDGFAGAGATGEAAGAGVIGQAGTAGGTAAVTPAAATTSGPTKSTAVSAPPVTRPRSRGLSRTTVVALIAIAICVLVALLATVA